MDIGMQGSGRGHGSTGVRERRGAVRPGAGARVRGAARRPLDGELLDVTGWSVAERAGGACLINDRGRYGAGGRAAYTPAEDDPQGPFRWEGDMP
ncbi:hypothetical protein AB0P12_30615 [Streptomyces subrutilus]|uniref:hypothetical protein n=1 Tax=Streptomyces subrutilus TaxID=36818 RepID=UPI00343A659E